MNLPQLYFLSRKYPNRNIDWAVIFQRVSLSGRLLLGIIRDGLLLRYFLVKKIYPPSFRFAFFIPIVVFVVKIVVPIFGIGNWQFCLSTQFL